MEGINVDIILPTYGRVEDLKESLTGLLGRMSNAQHSLKCIFLLEEEDVATREFCKNVANSTIVLNTSHLPLVQLFSKGLEQSSADYILFWNDDIFMWTDNWDSLLKETLKTCDFAGLKLTRRGSCTDFSPHTVFGIPYALIGGTTKQFLKEFGFLDPAFNLWYADPDFALRMIIEGKLQRWADILVTHKGGPPTPSYAVSANRDEKIFYERWQPRSKELQAAYSKLKCTWLV